LESGGDPVRLLERCRSLCAPGGAVIAEVEPPGVGFAPHRARLERGSTHGPWFPWAVVGADAVAAIAGSAGLRVNDIVQTTNEPRWFAHLIAGSGDLDVPPAT
jgi:hypothetical protein